MPTDVLDSRFSRRRALQIAGLGAGAALLAGTARRTAAAPAAQSFQGVTLRMLTQAGTDYEPALRAYANDFTASIGARVEFDRADRDFVERDLRYYTVKGVLWAMPFNVSAPVFYYNTKAFTKAGLDPSSPPKTLDQVKADAEKLKSSGAVTQAGFGLKNDPWYLQQWLAKTNFTFVSNGNGRNGPVSGAVPLMA